MVYDLRSKRTNYWFAAFAKNQAWILRSTKGINRDYVSDLLVPG
jgi:hypothetical protein